MIFRGTRSRAVRMAERPKSLCRWRYQRGDVSGVALVGLFSPDDVAGQARPTVLFEAGLAMAGVPPRRCRSGLSAVSLGYRSRNELSASGAVRACAMGGASVWECGGVDVNTRHDVSIGLDDPSGGRNLRLDASGAKRSLTLERWPSLVAAGRECQRCGVSSACSARTASSRFGGNVN